MILYTIYVKEDLKVPVLLASIRGTSGPQYTSMNRGTSGPLVIVHV